MAVSFRVKSRYAKSLIELAQEQKVLDKVKEDMQLFVDTCESNRDFMTFLGSPVVGHDKKNKILTQLFEGKVEKLTLMFFTLITKKNREKELYEISKEALNQYNRVKGITKATVETVIPLNDSLRKEFASMVEKATSKKVILSEIIDEDLIGGYILRVEDKQIDASVKSRLNKLKYTFDN